MKNSTRCVQIDKDERFGAVSTPIYQTATFRQERATEFGEFDYSRSGNPTRSQLERKIADLEHGRFGVAFASGMAAITAVTRLVKAGDEILAGDDLYGGSVRLLEQIVPNQGVKVRYADPTNPAVFGKAINENTKLILIETPTNPFLRVADISAIAEIARKSKAILAVDNTMLSPCLQNPLRLGADLVVHSATKFLSGHSDVTAGVIVTDDDEIYRRIGFVQNAEGTMLSPFDSWLLIRGLKTLALRVERQSLTAQKVAEFLAGHPAVKEVYYPGLLNDRQSEIHHRQTGGGGGGSVISFTTGDNETSRRFVEAVELCSIAVSFGSVNSTVSLPYYMSHASIPSRLRQRLAPPSDMVRLSVGIEDVDDIIKDINQALSLKIAAGV